MPTDTPLGLEELEREIAGAPDWQFVGPLRAGHLRALIARAAEEAGWRPIGEAPKDGTRILGWEPSQRDDDGRFTMEWSAEQERWLIVCNPFWVFEPTHFRLLPAPPTSKGDDHD